ARRSRPFGAADDDDAGHGLHHQGAGRSRLARERQSHGRRRACGRRVRPAHRRRRLRLQRRPRAGAGPTARGSCLVTAPPADDRLPVVIIACKVMETLLAHLVPPGLAREIRYLDYGLHRVPAKLTWSVQEAIDAVEEPSLIVLGYGLCGNG